VQGGPELATHHATLEYLRELGFPVNPEIRLVDDLSEVIEFCTHWQQQRHTLGYEIDGVVVKVDSLARAPVGHRLQVCPRAGADPPSQHPHPGGADWGADARGRSRARISGGQHHQPRHAP